MFLGRPLFREYEFAQQGSNLRNQNLSGLQHVMVKLNQLKVQRYTVVAADQVTSSQTTAGCNAGCASSKPVSTNTKFVFDGRTNNGYRKPEPVAGQEMIPKVSAFGWKHAEDTRRLYQSMRSKPRSRHVLKKPKVSAFGRKHAEHARRLYKSMSSKPPLGQVLVPSCRSNYGYMKARYKKAQFRDCLSETPVSYKNRVSLFPDTTVGETVYGASEPYQTLLKVAHITPRLDKKQSNKPKTFSEKDLSNAPLFQMLCEI